MVHASCPIAGVEEVAGGIFVLRFISPPIGASVRPGQFVNIKAGEGIEPLLRRPFSVYRVDGSAVEILFNVVGRGTDLLRRKREGEMIDVIGPAGTPFSVSSPDFETGIMIAGGLGVAPLPLVTAGLKRAGKKRSTFIGARTAGGIVKAHLDDPRVATDDGSLGMKGSVVELARSAFTVLKPDRCRIFACGPTAMLKAVAALGREFHIPCEVSLEGPMACGIGICQGCPVELAGAGKKYALMCKDGPVFDTSTIVI